MYITYIKSIIVLFFNYISRTDPIERTNYIGAVAVNNNNNNNNRNTMDATGKKKTI